MLKILTRKEVIEVEPLNPGELAEIPVRVGEWLARRGIALADAEGRAFELDRARGEREVGLLINNFGTRGGAAKRVFFGVLVFYPEAGAGARRKGRDWIFAVKGREFMEFSKPIVEELKSEFSVTIQQRLVSEKPDREKNDYERNGYAVNGK